MTTTLRVILDPIVGPVPSGIGRYTEELTRELINTTPQGCQVAGIVSASPEEDYERLYTLLPGLAGLDKSPLARRELRRAWQLGLGRVVGKGMIHATSLLAPLNKHDRLHHEGDQVVVTVHDVVPFTHPEILSTRRVNWYRSMLKRAHKYADAVVVPSHSVASQLNDIHNFGDRIRVIGGAVSSKLQLPVDADVRASALELPERYILAVGTLEPRKGLSALIESLAHPDAVDLPLIIVGPDSWNGIEVATVAAEAGLADGRVRTLGFLQDADLAVVIARATVFAFPSLAEGFGLPVIEAFSFGTPVVHSDDAAVLEVAAGAGLAVPREPAIGYAGNLAQAIASVVNDPALTERLRFSGLDRAKAFRWKDSAERVWQLHADL